MAEMNLHVHRKVQSRPLFSKTVSRVKLHFTTLLGGEEESTMILISLYKSYVWLQLECDSLAFKLNLRKKDEGDTEFS